MHKWRIFVNIKVFGSINFYLKNIPFQMELQHLQANFKAYIEESNSSFVGRNKYPRSARHYEWVSFVEFKKHNNTPLFRSV